MKLFSWIKNKNEETVKKTIKDSSNLINIFLRQAQMNVAFKIYAIQICINKIADAVSCCEMEIYNEGEYKKSNLWHKLNVSPNQNQTASTFWHKVIHQMIYNSSGALVIQSDDGQLLVADDYEVEKFAVRENMYSNVTVEGFTFSRTFFENEVMVFQMNNSNIRQIIDGVYDEYGKLIGGSIKKYNRSNERNYIIEVDAVFEQFKKVIDEDAGDTKYDVIMDEVFQERLRALFSEGDSAIPLERGLKLQEVGSENESRDSKGNSRDITALFDDILNICADAFGIPRGILKGDVADAEAMTDNFVAGAIVPRIKEIENEVNRKMFTVNENLNGSKCKIRTEGIRNHDITKLATSAELMARIGAFSTNRILRMIGEETINEHWADMHIRSKNYEIVEEVLKGGDENERTEAN